MLRKKTSAIKYNKNYNQKFEFMGWKGGGCRQWKGVLEFNEGFTEGKK